MNKDYIFLTKEKMNKAIENMEERLSTISICFLLWYTNPS